MRRQCWTYTRSFPVYTRSFNVVNGRAYVVETSNLQAPVPAAANGPDTVLWVVQPVGSNNGNVLGINDDIVVVTNPASRVTFTATFTGAAVAVVSDFANERYGFMDLTVRENGVVIVSHLGQRFGGFSLFNETVRANDRLFVGIPPGGGFTGLLATSLFYFSQTNLNCPTSPCGTYQSGSWDSGTLAQIKAIATSTTATLVVGASPFSPTTAVDVRFFNSRLASGWGATINADPDCDGLSRQLEGISHPDPWLNVSTCDTATGPSPDCSIASIRKYSSAVSTPAWAASDTDNDGFRDDVELYGRRFVCSSNPSAPFYDVGGCVEAVFAACGSTPPSGPYVITNALSAVGARPREADVYVEVLGSVAAQLNPGQLQVLDHVYEAEGLECLHTTSNNSADCPGDLANHNSIDLHIDYNLAYAEDLKMPLQAGWWPMMSYFNASMAPSRRNAFTHRYIWHNWNPGGQTSSTPARLGVAVGNQLASDDYRPYVMAHELGHMLGVPGDTNSPQPNYVSLMNYTNGDAAPRKQAIGSPDIWPNDFGAACAGNPNCVDGNCVGGFCSVRCERASIHFSRATLPTLSEVAQSEAAQRAAIAAGIRCGPAVAGLSPSCGATNNCSVDYNRNGAIAASSNNFDGVGGSTNPAVADQGDWATMRNKMRGGLDRAVAFQRFQQRFLVYASDLESVPPRQLSAFPLAVTTQAGVVAAVGFGPYSNAFDFPATCGGACGAANSITIADNPAIDSISKTLTGKAPIGVRFDAFIKMDDFATGTGHQIAYSDSFQMYVLNADRKLRWRVNSFLSNTIASQALTANTWYWVAGVWNRSTGNQRLCVVPWVGGQWDYTLGRCDWGTFAATTETEMNGLVIGRDPSTAGWLFKGLIDQVFLWNFPGVGPPGTTSDGCMWIPDFDPVMNTDVTYFPGAPPNSCGQ